VVANGVWSVPACDHGRAGFVFDSADGRVFGSWLCSRSVVRELTNRWVGRLGTAVSARRSFSKRWMDFVRVWETSGFCCESWGSSSAV
jgi:hypothetical protein